MRDPFLYNIPHTMILRQNHENKLYAVIMLYTTPKLIQVIWLEDL